MRQVPRRDRQADATRVCRAIRLLAEGRAPVEVAQAVRVRPATLEAWAADEDFRALLDGAREARQVRDALDALGDLAPGAIAALRRALEGDDMRLAIRAAHEVLERVGPLADRQAAQTIRVEYGTPDHQPVSTAPWAARHPAAPGALQGGGVREALREDGDGQDPDR